MGEIIRFLAPIIAVLLWKCLWGGATALVVSNRGYSENWFWWGFFFEFFAVIVAFSKPQNVSTQLVPSDLSDSSPAARPIKAQDAPGSWKCTCGRVNPIYTGTCVCGRTQQSVKAENQAHKEEEAQAKKDAAELTSLQKLKEYKELLDSGVITQEEFDKKKAKILG